MYPDDSGTAVATGSRLTHTCRVDEGGLITLPDGRQVQAAEKPLGEIESIVVDLYYPDLVKMRPSVYARVLEYRTYRVQVSGAVTAPGVYELRHDQLSLVSLLMEAGGIIRDGAAIIRIDRAEPARAKSVRQAVGRLSAFSELDGSRTVSTLGEWVETGVSEPPRIRLQFEREGPLTTTGWLDITKDDVVAVHAWLDIGNEPQRWRVLERAAEYLEPQAVSESHAELKQLATFLESGEPESRRRQDAAFAWRSSGDKRYATWVAASRPDHEIRQGRQPIGIVKAAYESEGETPERITGQDGDTAVVMPVRGLNIPFTDVALQEGDTVLVERVQPQWVSVLGLVNAPGNFPYPPESQYRLAEVLALAGGLDMVAEPRYVSVYRLRADGQVIGATFQLVDPDNQESLTQQLALKIKPGDVVSVEHTLRTRANLFFDRVFRISLGLYLSPEDIWE